MTLLHDILSDQLIDSFGMTFMHSLWQGCAGLMMYLIILYLLPGASALQRYRLAAVFTFLLLSAMISTFLWFYRHFTPAGSLSPGMDYGSTGDILPFPGLSDPFTDKAGNEGTGWWNILSLSRHYYPGILMVWTVGAGVMILRLLGGWIYLSQLRSSLRLVHYPEWEGRIRSLGARMSISGTIRMAESGRVSMPMVIGILKPLLVVPAGFLTGLPVSHVEVILAHEFAHIRHRDQLVNLIICLAEVLLFYHPAVWILIREVRREREHAADDLVVSTCGDSLTLAKALTRMQEYTIRRAPQLLALATDRRTLYHRIHRILNTDHMKTQLTSKPLVAITIIVTIALFSLAASARSALTHPPDAQDDLSGNFFRAAWTPTDTIRTVKQKKNKKPEGMNESTSMIMEERMEEPDLPEELAMDEPGIAGLEPLEVPGFDIPQEVFEVPEPPEPSLEWIDSLEDICFDLMIDPPVLQEPDSAELQEIRRQMERNRIEYRRAMEQVRQEMEELRERQREISERIRTELEEALVRQREELEQLRSGDRDVREQSTEDLRRQREAFEQQMRHTREEMQARHEELWRQMEETRQQEISEMEVRQAELEQEMAGMHRALESELRELDNKIKADQETLMDELVKDGFIKKGEHFSFRITSRELYINGTKQSEEHFRKYSSLMKSLGHDLDGDKGSIEYRK